MTEIEKLNQLETTASKQGDSIKKIEEAVKTELAKSQSSQAIKDAVLERILEGARDSGPKAVIGIETLNKKSNPNEVILPNGFKINLDALT